MHADRRTAGLTIAVWSFGHTWITDVASILEQIGFTTLEQTLLQGYKFGYGEPDQIRFASLRKQGQILLSVRKPGEIWRNYLTATVSGTKPKIIIITNCHLYSDGQEIAGLCEALNSAGVDVLCVGEPNTSFDKVVLQAGIKVRAHETCEHRGGSTEKVCGRQAQYRVWVNPSGKAPLVEFLKRYLVYLLPIVRISWLRFKLRSLISWLESINVVYPKVPLSIPYWFTERYLLELLFILFGSIQSQRRCRVHAPNKVRSTDKGGTIACITGVPNSRKSFEAARRLEIAADGSITESHKVLAYTAIPRGSDSALVPGYQPMPVRFPEEIVVYDETTTVAFDEAELFDSPVIETAIELAVSRGVNVLFVLYGFHWTGRPAANMDRILAMSEELVTLLGKCFATGCEELATRTALVTTNASNVMGLITSSTFTADVLPYEIKKSLGLKVVAACFHHCDPTTVTRDFVCPELEKGGGLVLGTLPTEILRGLLEDFRDKRLSTIALASVLALLLLIPEVTWAFGTVIREIVVAPLLATVAVLGAAHLLSIRMREANKARVFQLATLIIILHVLRVLPVYDLIVWLVRILGWTVTQLRAVLNLADGYVTSQYSLPDGAGRLIIVFTILLSLGIWWVVGNVRRKLKRSL